MPKDVIHVFIQGKANSGKTELFGTHPLLFRITPQNTPVSLVLHRGALSKQAGPRVIFYCVDLGEPVDLAVIESDIQAIYRHPEFSKKNTLICLVGTKADLPDAATHYQVLEACSFQLGLGHPIRTSVMTGEGMEQLQGVCYFLVQDELKAPLRQCKILYQKVRKELVDAIAYLPWTMRRKIQGELDLLERGGRTIYVFHQNCKTILGERYASFKKMVILLMVVAVITFLIAAIGFGIGLVAGAWLGVAGMLSGVAAGSSASVSVVSASLAAGVGAGYMTQGFMKPPKKTAQQEVAALITQLQPS
ncbi:MAG: GTPase domain-containing protein [Gammaproteobacteria bacterium]|nr:GTPase domain-containing protein [Gammaproteobacteria bacterium]